MSVTRRFAPFLVGLLCFGSVAFRALPVQSTSHAIMPGDRSFELYVMVGEIPIWMGNTIRYSVFETTLVEARFLTPAGEIIMILQEGERVPGQYTLPWDGTRDGSQFVGFYTFELYFGDEYAAKLSIVVNPNVATS